MAHSHPHTHTPQTPQQQNTTIGPCHRNLLIRGSPVTLLTFSPDQSPYPNCLSLLLLFQDVILICFSFFSPPPLFSHSTPPLCCAPLHLLITLQLCHLQTRLSPSPGHPRPTPPPPLHLSVCAVCVSVRIYTCVRSRVRSVPAEASSRLLLKCSKCGVISSTAMSTATASSAMLVHLHLFLSFHSFSLLFFSVLHLLNPLPSILLPEGVCEIKHIKDCFFFKKPATCMDG